MPVPITFVELIYGLRLLVKTVHEQFTIPDALLHVVLLVTNVDSFPLQPLDRHSYAFLGFKLIFRHGSHVTSRWHILYECPEVQGIGII